MCLVYNLKLFSKLEIEKLKQWSIYDPPHGWELEYHRWIAQDSTLFKNISNPLISNPQLIHLNGLFDSITVAESNSSSLRLIGIRPSSNQVLLFNANDNSLNLSSSHYKIRFLSSSTPQEFLLNGNFNLLPFQVLPVSLFQTKQFPSSGKLELRTKGNVLLSQGLFKQLPNSQMPSVSASQSVAASSSSLVQRRNSFSSVPAKPSPQAISLPMSTVHVSQAPPSNTTASSSSSNFTRYSSSVAFDEMFQIVDLLEEHFNSSKGEVSTNKQ